MIGKNLRTQARVFPIRRRAQSGFNLTELMIALALGLLILLALIAVFLNVTRSNREMARANTQIENGRFAIQLLNSDIVHAGFWGGYVPRFDDLSMTELPTDVPSAVPDPCLAYNAVNWTGAYKSNLVGIPVQAYDAIPASCAAAPAALDNLHANSDVLVVRHLEPCVPGTTNCDADVAGRLYFQSSRCTRGIFPVVGTAQAGGANTITLASYASMSNNAYNGMTITLTGGTGAGQSRVVLATNGYNGSTRVATVATNWTLPQPNNTTTYSIQPTAVAGSSNTITLDANASSAANAYTGMTITLTGGTGAGQSRVVDAYNGASKVATLAAVPAANATWTTAPDSTSTYSIGEYVLDTAGFTLHQRGANCSTATVAEKRRFISNIYYVRDFAVTPGDGIPTLVRSQFDLSGGVLAHQPAVALIEGIEAFRVELGIDDTMTRCAPNTAVNYGVVASDRLDPVSCTVNADTSLNSLPRYRGDGIPDAFVHCTTGTPCTLAQFTNTVAAKLYVLARNLDTTPGHVDGKTYTLGGITLPAFNDGYERHVFGTTVRLTNISGRRETQ